MTRKIISKASPGVPGTTFGSDDIDYINQYFTGVDQSASDAVDINTTTKFRNTKARIANSANNANVILESAASSSDKTWTFPNITGTGVTEAGTQTLTNKTVSGATNTISNVPKTALPASVLHNDQNNSLGAFYQDLTQIGVPGNPASGVRRIFVDSATGKLSVRTDAGTTVDLESAGGGGSWDPAAAETLTNKTIVFANNTLTNVASTNTAQTFSAVKTFSSAPVISSITNTGTLTLPTSTDTLVGRATTDTLTNKTVSGASNTLSNIPKGAIPAATLYNDVDNALGAHYMDVEEIAVPGNPAADVRRIFVNSATGKVSVRTDAGTTVSLEEQPNWSPSATETLTNKTIDFDDNTLTDVAGVSATQTLTNKTLTTPIIASISNSGTITVPTGTHTLATLAGTETFTNKTITTPIIATIKPDASNSLNLPVGNDTLAALTLAQTLTNKTLAFANNTLTNVASLDTAQTLTNKTVAFADNTLTGVASTSTAQTLTNKTISSINNTLEKVQQSNEVRFMGGFQVGGTSSTATWGHMPGSNLIGNAATNVQSTTLGTLRRHVTTTTLNNQSGVRHSNATMVTAQKPRLRCRFRLMQNTLLRFAITFVDDSSAPTAGSDDWLNNRGGFGLFVRSTDTIFQIGHNDGGTPGVYENVAGDPAVDASVFHTVDIYSDYGVGWKLQFDGGTVTNITTDVPLAGSGLGNYFVIETAESGVLKQADFAWHSVEWLGGSAA